MLQIENKRRKNTLFLLRQDTVSLAIRNSQLRVLVPRLLYTRKCYCILELSANRYIPFNLDESSREFSTVFPRLDTTCHAHIHIHTHTYTSIQNVLQAFDARRQFFSFFLYITLDHPALISGHFSIIIIL